MARILSGKDVAEALSLRLAERVRTLEEKGVKPTLAILRVGERPDDLAYERGAVKRCEKLGVAVKKLTLSGDCTQAELMAAIQALNALKVPCEVDLYTDSAYVKDGISKWIFGWKKNGWKTADKKPVKNAELWQQLEEARNKHKGTLHWVKGHAGHPENERADELARQGMAPFKKR